MTLIWGVLHVLTFTHAQILTWGAFGALWALTSGWPVWGALLAGMLTGGLLAVIIDVTVLATLRRRGASEYAYVIATIGVALILSAILKWHTHSQYVALPRDGLPHGAMEILGQNVPRLQATVLGISVVVMTVLALWLGHTRSGRAMRAVAYSRESAELLGINSRRIYAMAHFISGVLAALAGVFVSVATANVSYSSGDRLLLTAFAVVVLGGMGSVWGAVAGGLLLGLIEVYATVYVSSTFREAAAFLTILVVLLVRPSGLFGARQAFRV